MKKLADGVWRGSWVALGVFLSAAGVGAFDHSSYDKILKRHVTEEGLVDYEGLRQKDAGALRTYLKSLEGTDPSGWSYQEKLAFWINAYNAHMIQHILDNPGLKKVSDKFELFDSPLRIAGGDYSLNDIEHRVLRGKPNPKSKKGPVPGVTLEKFDPRIHFALVCAALDCPKLRNVAYTAGNVEKTLAENASLFANSAKHLAVEGGRLRVSSILKWFEEDFQSSGGVTAYMAQLTDPAKRADEAQVDQLLKTKFYKADFQYDWTVNDVRNKK